MYDFKKEGFSGLLVGREIEYYKEKISDAKISSNKHLIDQLLRGTVEIADIQCGFRAKINPDGIAHMVELSWETNDFSFEGIPLAGFSMDQFADELISRGYDVEKDGSVLKLVDVQVSFFFYEEVSASIAWWLPSFYDSNVSM